MNRTRLRAQLKQIRRCLFRLDNAVAEFPLGQQQVAKRSLDASARKRSACPGLVLAASATVQSGFPVQYEPDTASLCDLREGRLVIALVEGGHRLRSW